MPDPANPYAPPATESLVEPVRQDPLASRWQRFQGAFVDSLFAIFTNLPMFFALGLDGLAQSDESLNPFAPHIRAGSMGLLSGGMLLVLVGIQSYLVATRGQSIGKMAVGTRIVRSDDTPIGFRHGVLERTWLFMLLGYIPVLGGFLMILDVLFIFGNQRRCLHDLVAGSKVIVV